MPLMTKKVENKWTDW